MVPVTLVVLRHWGSNSTSLVFLFTYKKIALYLVKAVAVRMQLHQSVTTYMQLIGNQVGLELPENFYLD